MVKVSQPVALLEHDRLIYYLVMEILWVNGFYKDIDFEDLQSLDGVIALAQAGAAICSAIQEYETGIYKRIEFSTAKSRGTYRDIRTYISDKIYTCIELTVHYNLLKVKIREHGEARLGL
jgi:hypothetical protein